MTSPLYFLPYVVQAVLAFAVAAVWLCGWWRGLRGPALGLMIFAWVGFGCVGLLAGGFYFYAYQGNTMSLTDRAAILSVGSLTLVALSIALLIVYAVAVYLFAWQRPPADQNRPLP